MTNSIRSLAKGKLGRLVALTQELRSKGRPGVVDSTGALSEESYRDKGSWKLEAAKKSFDKNWNKGWSKWGK